MTSTLSIHIIFLSAAAAKKRGRKKKTPSLWTQAIRKANKEKGIGGIPKKGTDAYKIVKK